MVIDNPEKFDWVSARSECSAAEVFERLRAQVKRDVEKREEISQRQQNPRVGSQFAFKFLEEGPTFIAMVEGAQLHKTVRFECTANSITARGDDEKPSLTAALTLSNDGQCRLVVNGQEYELWQFRKMALESLFFSPYQRPQLKGLPTF